MTKRLVDIQEEHVSKRPVDIQEEHVSKRLVDIQEETDMEEDEKSEVKFLANQLILPRKKPNGHRYDASMMKIAISLYLIVPHCTSLYLIVPHCTSLYLIVPSKPKLLFCITRTFVTTSPKP